MTSVAKALDFVARAVSWRPHSFHIPVMGTGFTLDTPLRVGKYGISSVISLVDDTLIEQLRRHHCEVHNEPYEEISGRDPDCRAKRIRAYLNLLHRLIAQQSRELRAAPFEPGSEITRYFELLPESSPLRQQYATMYATHDAEEKLRLQAELRKQALPSPIDANIMTALDRDHRRGGKTLPPEYSDAMSALRGFAQSDVDGSIVMSAGLNRRLYSYMREFDDFYPDSDGLQRKRITLKVSDYRSARIQGKSLAKAGLWVSEYRVESCINCGGHAFPAKGLLMGPILDEFRANRTELTESLYQTYGKALERMGRSVPSIPDVRVTAQCGISTVGENNLLLQRYELDGTGWGTPFLLVPEAANVDPETLEQLAAAKKEDVVLSDGSPLQIPFWLLRTCEAEDARRQRIAKGKPGASCCKKHAQLNTELTEKPVCIASRTYVERKLEDLETQDLSTEQRASLRERVLGRVCACHELGGSLSKLRGIGRATKSLVCPGPNIADFLKAASLEEMVDHIYGRAALMLRDDTPHMFVREIRIYLDYLRKEVGEASLGLSTKTQSYFTTIRENLLGGIEYYTKLFEENRDALPKRFLQHLQELREQIDGMVLPALPAQA